MSWYKINFNSKQFINQIPSLVSSLCFQLIKTQQDAKEMVILFQMAPGNNIYESYYFSPKVAEILLPIIQKYNGIVCEQPTPSSDTLDLSKMIGFVAGDQSYFMKLYGNQMK